jgi:hypothetical protein
MNNCTSNCPVQSSILAVQPSIPVSVKDTEAIQFSILAVSVPVIHTVPVQSSNLPGHLLYKFL